MKRYPAFDPPEYLDWSPQPELVEEYARRIEVQADRVAWVEALDGPTRMELYRDLLRTRLHDVGLKRWVRTGVISKAWLGTGEEAVTVGSVAALNRGTDVVCPMIRNAGALHMMGMPLADMFRGYLATADSPSGGRDLHLGDPGRGIIAPVSQMGSSVPVMAGVALAFKQRREERVALTWVGEGALRTGAFHEGVNFAATQDLPLVVVIQNNQVALGTRLDPERTEEVAKAPAAYGVPAFYCDGNHVLDVYGATRIAVERCRAGGGPAAVVADTFRMGGHATHDEREARETFPASLFEHWGLRDPIGLYEEFLKAGGVSQEALEEIEGGVIAEIEQAIREALESRELTPAPRDALYPGFSEGGPLVGLEKRPV